ncbi:MAG: serine protease [Lachnospiraceae bacterium]|nr:serine protease [Lachnospiraceae bacterium]
MRALSLFSCLPLEREDLREAATHVRMTQVTVRTDGRRGQGSICRIGEEEILVFTAVHVIGDAEDGTVLFSPQAGSSFEAPFSVLARSDAEDAILLSVRTTDIPPQITLGLREIAGETPDESRVSVNAGQEDDPDRVFPAEGTSLFCFCGEEVRAGVMLDVPAFQRKAAENADGVPADARYCLMSADPGMSGGAIFDARGCAVGMILGGNEEIVAFLPAEKIKTINEEKSFR